MPAGRPSALDLDASMPVIMRMFWRDGYEGSTLDQVAAALGVTKPTLCRTLGDKQAIFAAALQAYHQEHIAPAERDLDQATTLREALESVFALFVERTLTDDLPEGCFLGDTASLSDFASGAIAVTLRDLQNRLASSVQGRVERAIGAGELDPTSTPAPVVHYLLGQFAAISAISRTQPTRAVLDAVVRYMLDGLPWAHAPDPTHNRLD